MSENDFEGDPGIGAGTAIDPQPAGSPAEAGRAEEPAPTAAAPAAGTGARLAIDAKHLAALCAPLGAVVSTRELEGGLFAAVHRVDLADGRAVVVKATAADESHVLRYERGIIGAEAQVLRLHTPAGPLSLLPELLLEDRSRTAIDGDAIVMSLLEGELWSTLTDAGRLDPRQHDSVHRTVGRFLATLNARTGPFFGYLAPEPELRADTWTGALTAMVGAALDDAEHWSVPLPADRIRQALDKNRWALDEVTTPRLVHGDLWRGNVFLDPSTFEVRGIIDAERAFYGDPLYDLMATDALNMGELSPAMLAGYREAGAADIDVPGRGGRATDARLAMCRLYMHLVMIVEIAPRAYSGEWLGPYRDELWHNLEQLLEKWG